MTLKLAVAAVVVAMLGGAVRANGPDKGKPAAITTPPSKTEWVTVEDSAWMVIESTALGKVARSNNPFEHDMTTEGSFVLVRFKVESHLKRPDIVHRHPELLDSAGRRFHPVDHQAFFVPERDKTIGGEQLPPSVPKSFSAVYEVASDSYGLAFEARTLSMMGDSKWIPLVFTATQPPKKSTAKSRKPKAEEGDAQEPRQSSALWRMLHPEP